MIKGNVSISGITKPILGFFQRFHAIIFFLIVSTCLFIAIFLLLPITNLSSKESQTTGEAVDSSFDQATIDKLRNGSGSASAYQPGARKSPFSE